MPRYTVMMTAPDGGQHVVIATFRDDASAIRDAGTRVGPERRSIAVARGEGAALEFLGAWDLIDGEAIWWAD